MLISLLKPRRKPLGKSALITFFGIILSCSVTLRLYPAPCYGTRLPEEKKFFFGVQTYNIFKRNLEDSFGRVRSLQHFFEISYGLTRWLSIDLKGGAGYIKQHPQSSDELDYPSSFAGGYGFRIKLLDFQEEGIEAVFGFQHISVHPRSIYINTVKDKSVLDDWQASLLVSKNIYDVIPYLGVKWSRVDYIHWEEETRKRRMSDLTESWGLVLGIDVPFVMESWINIEGHFFDEEAASLAIRYEF